MPYIHTIHHNQGISNFVTFIEHELYNRALNNEDIKDASYTVFLRVDRLNNVSWEVIKASYDSTQGVVYSNEEVMNVVAERLNAINKGIQCK